MNITGCSFFFKDKSVFITSSVSFICILSLVYALRKKFAFRDFLCVLYFLVRAKISVLPKRTWPNKAYSSHNISSRSLLTLMASSFLMDFVFISSRHFCFLSSSIFGIRISFPAIISFTLSA